MAVAESEGIFGDRDFAIDAGQRNTVAVVGVFQSQRLRRRDEKLRLRGPGLFGFFGLAPAAASGLRSYFTRNDCEPVTFFCSVMVKPTQPSAAFSSRICCLMPASRAFGLNLGSIGGRLGNGDAEGVDGGVLDLEDHVCGERGRVLTSVDRGLHAGRQPRRLAERSDVDRHRPMLIRPSPGRVESG